MTDIWLAVNVMFFGFFLGSMFSDVAERRSFFAGVHGAMAGLYGLLTIAQSGRVLGWWP